MFITNIIKTLFSSQKPKQILLLGRWNIQYEPKIIHFKVDQSNEAHCGCCQMLPDPKNKEQTQKEQDEYLLPYTL